MSKSNVNSCQADIIARFDEKIKKLEKSLPLMKLSEGINCAELTLTSVLDILGIDNFFFHNVSIPLAGGFGGYKSKEGWQGACGAVAGGCAAIGVIMGGQERIPTKIQMNVMLKASKYASDFEKQFGSVVCNQICGYDFGDLDSINEYRKNEVWKNTCYKFVTWAVDRIRKLTRRELKQNWE